MVISGFIEPDISAKDGKPQINILPDRTVLSDMGLSPLNIGMIMRANLEGMKVVCIKVVIEVMILL